MFIVYQYKNANETNVLQLVLYQLYVVFINAGVVFRKLCLMDARTRRLEENVSRLLANQGQAVQPSHEELPALETVSSQEEYLAFVRTLKDKQRRKQVVS